MVLKEAKQLNGQKILPKPLFSNRKKLLAMLFLPTFPVKKVIIIFERKKIE
jgi:hypothetical protein